MWTTLLKREYGYKLKNQKMILIQKVAQLLFTVSIKVVLDFFNRPTSNFKMKYLPPQENSESIEASIVCEYLSVSVGYNAVYSCTRHTVAMQCVTWEVTL